MKGQAEYFTNLFTEYIQNSPETRLFKRGELLCATGEVEHNLFLIKEGAVRAYYLDNNEEITIRFGYSGSVINSMGSFLSQEPSDLSIQVLRKTEALVLKRSVYMDFINSSKTVMKMHVDVIHQLLLSMLDREKDLLTQSPKERYRRVLKRSPQLFQEVPLKYIASYLRMTPETLSRLRSS